MMTTMTKVSNDETQSRRNRSLLLAAAEDDNDNDDQGFERRNTVSTLPLLSAS